MPRAKLAKDAKRKAAKQASLAATDSQPADGVSANFCPVVGVGASAGGLEAFTQLLQHLPKKTGLAFALVQHLDPEKASHLSEILSRATDLSVAEVKDGIHLEPDHVYVIPPNASMSVSDGTLALAARKEGRARHFPIDHFFSSLAAHRGNKAIGIVLSGNASDGTLGLKAIKAAGGITFAQDEGSAKFPGMPRSATAAGFVDFVLSPEKIAEELGRLGSAPYVTSAKDRAAEPQPADALRRVFKELRTASGVDFSSYRQTTIQRRIQRRLVVRRAESLEAYLKVLEKHPEEMQALFRDILIHVTNFFREPETFAALAAQVYPEILKNHEPGTPIRVWVPGCSTGEEAYSLAISLAEFLGEKADGIQVQVFGTDVSDEVVEAARRGVFDTSVEADVSPDRLRRFFTKVERGYQINKSIRDLCVFARQNVVKDPPFSKLDLVSCRNVLIYFEAALQKRLIPVFHYALKSRGHLLLGSAETVGSFGDLFSTVDAKHKIFLRLPAGETTPLHLQLNTDFPAIQRGIEGSEEKIPAHAWSRLDVLKEADRLVTAKYCPPGLVLNDDLEIIQFRGEVAPYLNPGSGEASLNLFKMTRPAFAAELRSAIAAARKGSMKGRKYSLLLDLRGELREVVLEVMRIDPPAAKERAFVVNFEESPGGPPASEKKERANANGDPLEDELATAQAHLQSLFEEHEATNEELRSANEEIQSSNEELQSTNEELETAKEELQSTNEELTTLNEELRHHNRDLAAVNDDLTNLLRSMSLPVVMLGRDLRIRRFTPGAEKFFKLIPTDVGRLITDINADIGALDLEALVRGAIDDLCVKEHELQDGSGRWRRLQVRPFETADNRIAGAVLILFDIDVTRENERLKLAANYADAIIDTVHEPLLVLDGEFRVKRATEAFLKGFRVKAEATEGRILYELGNGQWNIPALRKLLDKVLPKNARVKNFKVEHTFPAIGRKTMLLNASRVTGVGEEESLIVLSVAETAA